MRASVLAGYLGIPTEQLIKQLCESRQMHAIKIGEEFYVHPEMAYKKVGRRFKRLISCAVKEGSESDLPELEFPHLQ